MSRTLYFTKSAGIYTATSLSAKTAARILNVSYSIKSGYYELNVSADKWEEASAKLIEAGHTLEVTSLD